MQFVNWAEEKFREIDKLCFHKKILTIMIFDLPLSIFLPEQKMFLQHWTLQLKFPHFPLDFEDMRGFLVHFVHVQPLPRVPGEQ